jgi:serine/threonine protein kinase
MDLETGARLGSYRIVRRIGRGASGMVYQAVHPEFGDVALKLMLAELVTEESARVRFVREAETLVRLRHRNVVTVFESGVSDNTPFLAMELLTGSTLAATLASRETMSLERKLDILIQLCDGLQFVHERGVIHRDVKPANVWLTSNAGVKLLDFGIAHTLGSTFTRVGDVIGSVAYMAPEQVAGQELDGRADIFAAGVVLYELLAGRRPFEADGVSAVMHRILNEQAIPVASLVPGLSPDVVLAVETALQKDIAARYAQAEDFGSDLRLARYAEQQDSDRTIVTAKTSSARTPSPQAVDAPTLLVPARSTGHSRPSSDTATSTSAGTRSLEPSQVPAITPVGSADPGAATGAVQSQVRPNASTVVPEGARRTPVAVPQASAVEWVRSRPRVMVGAAAVAVALMGVWLQMQAASNPEFRLDVRSEPSGAAIAVDGVPIDDRTPAVVSLSARPTRVRLTVPGYEAIEREVDAVSLAQPLPLSMTLRRLVRVDSEPSGARIRVDGRDTGLSTPADVPMALDSRVSLQLESGRRLRGEVGVTEAMLKSGVVKVSLTAWDPAPPDRRAAETDALAPASVGDRGGRAKAGTMAVTVHVTGSYPFEISGCGQSSPAAAAHELAVDAPCQLRLRAPKYHLDDIRSIGASAGRVDMAAPQLARVQLRSKLEVCTVILNDQAVGSPPVDLELAAGTYRVAIQCPDRTYAIRALTIEPGQSTRRLDDLLP